MPKTVRVNFQKGITGSWEPRLAGDGYALLLHNVDLRSGIAKRAKSPVFKAAVAASSTCVWFFKGTFYASENWRDWAGEVVGDHTRVYYTEADMNARKIINGTEADLGQPVPTTAPVIQVNATGEALTLTSEVAATGGTDWGWSGTHTFEYCVGAFDSDGNYLAVSNRVRIPSIANTPGSGNYPKITLTWNAYDGAGSYKIYGRYYEEALTLISSTGDLTWADDNTLQPDGTPLPSVIEARSYAYIYTYMRDVNGHVDESGPSPVSETVETAQARVIDLGNAAGILFDATGGASFTNPSPTITVPLSSGGTALTVTSIFGKTGKTIIALSTAHGLTDGATIGLVNFLPSTLVKYAKVKVPTALGKPVIKSAVVVPKGGDPNGKVPVGTHVYTITAVRGVDPKSVGFYGNTGYGAQTTVSDSVSVVVADGDDPAIVTLHFESPGADGVYIYRDGAYLRYSPAGRKSFDDMSLKTLAIAPSAPSANLTSTHCLELDGVVADSTMLDSAPNQQIIKNPTATVTIGGAGHGQSSASFYVRLSAFTDTALNGIWQATKVDTASFTIPSYCTVAQTSGSTAYKVEVAGSGGGGSGGTSAISGVTGLKLYRVGDVALYSLVAEIPLDQTTYTDTKTTLELGGQPDSYYDQNGQTVVFAPPPSDLTGLITHNGMLVGISGRTIRWTPINRPDAWPDVMAVTIPAIPTRLISYAGSIVILSPGGLWRLELFSPTLPTLVRTPAEHCCVAPLSAAVTPVGIVYLSQDGLAVFDGARNASYSLFPNRLTARYFMSPSGATSNFGHWWYPANRGFTYNYLTRDLQGEKRTGMAASMDGQAVFPDSWTAPRGIYAQGRYYLFYAGDASNHPNHHALEVNLDVTPPVPTSFGIRALGACADESGNVFWLLPGVGGGTGADSLAAAIALEGTDANADGGMAGRSDASPNLFHWPDAGGTTTRLFIRTGPIGPVLHERVRFRSVDFHGTGSGKALFWIDNTSWRIPETGYAEFQASENPTHARRIMLPRGAVGYYIDVEVSGDCDLIALEIAFDPVNKMEP